jgi:hypothetical protein
MPVATSTRASTSAALGHATVVLRMSVEMVVIEWWMKTMKKMVPPNESVYMLQWCSK